MVWVRMSKKTTTYDAARSYLYDKDKYVTNYIERKLAETIRMFSYEGLPDSISPNDLERIIQTNGTVGFIDINDTLYALSGSFSGVRDAYGNFTEYQISNEYLNVFGSYKIGRDCIVCKNDSMGNSLIPIMGKYATLTNDAEITLDTVAILARITMTITAPDDKSKQSAEQFLSKIMNGEFSIIGDNALFDGVKSQSMMDSAQRLNQVIETLQYIKASSMNELGIVAATNLKRERVNTQEVAQANVGVMAYPNDMLMNRIETLEKVNAKYGTNIRVSFSSVWDDNNGGDNIVDSSIDDGNLDESNGGDENDDNQ